ncbi:amino acid ABC transporter ATP-binding protein [Leucobacter sp. wl10]|uniref:amino acid ABC transporter ATP-binding protein n=1 Tax=Leucobacter sp. wl10 TaxID=2304677 RepID=UPI000E5BBD6F|nr:amino acid ABC transporter ATP-binding protein [Leucobacter sp. wl10]RGE20096.1 amino acid ABC transporter ATP-binding protein [Leucobacter sp. wl10]
MSSEAFIEYRDVSKAYGETRVLNDINLSVKKHEVICLIGASGSGKSTLLRVTNGLEEIAEGEVAIEGDVVSGPGVDLVQLRRKIGMVFQSYNLFPHMSVLKNCILTPVETGLMSRAEATDAAQQMLERIGLGDKGDSYPDRLSGGQQQRVAIARSLLMRPKALLLDEITAALDPELVMEVLDLVRELAETGMTLILATHEMSFAREVSDRICFLHQSRLLEVGPPEQIFDQPQEKATRQFLRRVNEAGRMR